MIRRRSLLFQFIVYILTLGLYGLYWFYSTLDEMMKRRGENTGAVLWTIALFIPIVNFFAVWKHASTVDKLTEGKYPALLLWLVGVFFIPAYWIIVQIELNNIAGTPAESAA